MKRLQSVLAIVAVAAAGAADAGARTFSFDSDLEGWTPSNATISWQTDGGGSNGFLQFSDEVGLSEIIAPAAWSGDLSFYQGGAIQLDIRRISPVTPPAESPLSTDFITIVGSAGTARAIFGAVAPADWTTYTFNFDAVDFQFGGSNLNAILADVIEIRISADLYGMAVDGGEIYGIDNIAIIPTPGSALLIACAGVPMILRRRR